MLIDDARIHKAFLTLRIGLPEFLTINLVLNIIPIMNELQIVIDTNVFVAALKSRNGASFRLFQLIGQGKFSTNISVPLILEYVEAAKRQIGQIALNEANIDNIINYICSVSHHRRIYYLWRPFLKDPKDDLVLELAILSESECIITYNKKNFAKVPKQFGVRILTPLEFLLEIGEIK